MVSWSARYDGGEHRMVWDEIRALGAVPDRAHDDVRAVAESTMQRALPQILRIVDEMTALGLEPSSDQVHEPPEPADADTLHRLAVDGVLLPAALHAQLLIIGGLWLAGDCPELGLAYHAGSAPVGMPPGVEYPDPLVLPNAGWVADEYERFVEDDWEHGAFLMDFAPDELHKRNISGGSQSIDLSVDVADPVLHGVAGRAGITLVEYLRTSVSWGGLPGYQFGNAPLPPVLDRLRARPDF